MESQICYCFGYSEEDITLDVVENNGRSLIMERILGEKKVEGATPARPIRSAGDAWLMSAG